MTADAATLVILLLIGVFLATSTLTGIAAARTVRAIGRWWHGRRAA